MLNVDVVSLVPHTKIKIVYCLTVYVLLYNFKGREKCTKMCCQLYSDRIKSRVQILSECCVEHRS